MTSARTARIAGIVVAGSLALAVPFLVSAQSAPDAQREGRHAGAHLMSAHGGGHGHQRGHVGFGPGMGGMQGGEHLSGRMLRGLDLTDEQRDRVFAIQHANAPAMRDQAKVLRGARSEFAKLALSGEYDEAKVKEIADRNAQAISAMAQLRAKSMNEIYRVLTPEQQAQVKERLARWEERGARGEGRGMRGEGRRGGPGIDARPATPRS